MKAMYVYADNASTTRLNDNALAEMTKVHLRNYGNPSSSHSAGQAAKDAVRRARAKIAECINAEPEEIYFTSGGTESNNWAIRMCQNYYVAASEIEHPSVLNAMEEEDVLIPVSSGCVVSPSVVSNLFPNGMFGKKTGAISVMLANNETGVIQPIEKISELCRSFNVLFHTDAVQAVGHIPVDVKALGVDMLSASAHKFHGPKGVGFLYVRKDTYLAPFIQGGGQERGMRSGTENVSGIVGMAAALYRETESMSYNAKYIKSLRDIIIDGLLDIQGSRLNGDGARLLPGIINVGFEGVVGESLVSLLDQRGICVSSGSACSSGDLKPSHVLLAMGQSEEEAKSAIRISLSKYNTEEQAKYIVKSVAECVSYIRSHNELS